MKTKRSLISHMFHDRNRVFFCPVLFLIVMMLCFTACSAGGGQAGGPVLQQLRTRLFHRGRGGRGLRLPGGGVSPVGSQPAGGARPGAGAPPAGRPRPGGQGNCGNKGGPAGRGLPRLCQQRLYLGAGGVRVCGPLLRPGRPGPARRGPGGLTAGPLPALPRVPGG